MYITNSISELKLLLSSQDTSLKLGLVPTMGALHEGHVSLIKKAVAENNLTVVSIFVNPTQFNNNVDLDKYPRTLATDVQLIDRISNEIIIFAPSVSEMYPKGQLTKNYDFKNLDKVMEGTFRKGHFNGVATIVEMLFLLVKPDNAYFGEKDFQQLQIIRHLVASKKIPVNIIGCPIIREPNGLARSSRNERLSKEMRNEASIIYKTLIDAKKNFKKMSISEILNWGKKVFNEHPNLDLEYFNIANSETLEPAIKKEPKVKYILFIAVYAEGIRLIDNINLN